jgi:Skp family chaperone for outer membrane proteins
VAPLAPRLVTEDHLLQQGALNVKKSHLLAALAASILWWASAGPQALGQAVPARTAAGPASGTVALVDINYIFEKHARFKTMMNDLKADVERAEQEIQQKRDGLQKRLQDLERYRGTADYKRMEQELAKENGDLAVEMQLKRKEFVQREARIYYTVYQEILQEIEYFCNAQGIDMVLRFSGDPVDVEDPNKVLARMNQDVVWYSKDRDITGYILQAILKRGESTGVNPQVGQNPNVFGTRTN